MIDSNVAVPADLPATTLFGVDNKTDIILR